MKSGIVNLNNILEDLKGKNGNNQKGGYGNNLKKNDSDLWDFD